MADEIIRLSVSDSAKLFGIDQKTIRRALKNNELRYVVVRGRYKISFESMLVWSQQKPRVKNRLEQKGIGQYVGDWKIKNTHYSPNPKIVLKKKSREREKDSNIDKPISSFTV